MATTEIQVRNARGVKVKAAPLAAASVGRGVAAARRGASRGALDALLDSLAQQEVGVYGQLSITPVRSGGRGLRARPPAASFDVDVPISPLESAAILVEQDGLLSWHFPQAARPGPKRRQGAARRRAVAGSAATVVRIPVTLPTTSGGTAARRGLRGTSFLSRAKAIVMRFIARTAAGVTMQLLERSVHEGLIVMNGTDPDKWQRISRLDDLALPNRPLRIMLWIHGTFSSTVGGFGSLAATEEGKALLTRASGTYDAILGFDHRTLSATPLQNAIELAERLGRFARPMQIDAVMHSRGGLVYRSLVELVLPTSAQRPTMGAAVFVGVPNNGTSFASPKHWRMFVDTYTNSAMGAYTLLDALGARSSALVLRGLVSGVGAFVKYLASTFIERGGIPGLASMEPGGAFLGKLNAGGVGQPRPESCRYLAVTSNFDPRQAAQSARPIGLARAYLLQLANGLVDKLFDREHNDLVVNSASMKHIDGEAASFIDAALDFGDSAVVYHTVYFAQQQVAQQINAWLLDPSIRRGLAARRGVVTVLPSGRRPFTRIKYHDAVPGLHARTSSAARPAAAEPRADVDKTKDLTAARAKKVAAGHLRALLGERQKAKPAALNRAPKANEARNYAPKLSEERVQVSRASGRGVVHVVSYRQTHRDIPIFGAGANVELTSRGGLVAARAKLAMVTGVTRKPKLSTAQAVQRLLGVLGLPSRSKVSITHEPALYFFHARATDTWHLTYCFEDVPARPPQGPKPPRTLKHRRAGCDGHRIGPSPRQRFPRYDYLLDANTGALVYYYSRTPTAAARPMGRVPAKASGHDDEGIAQRFFALPTGKRFDLHDPARFVRTHDLKDGDIDTARVPRLPISSVTANFGATNGAAISAHVNAGRVFDFYNSVLIRRGVDDQGSVLTNVVNCTSPLDEPPPQWLNAVWYRGKMWYGQAVKGSTRRSLARYLDIIGHELTHGVTEHTCNLVYREEPGALNESFSDIFGVIINNWVKRPGVPTQQWDWDIGPGLGDSIKKPLRNMARPALTGDPAHTKDMLRLGPNERPDDSNDLGYVHSNSNIHNKAAYNLLTAKSRGRRAGNEFEVRDVALLYYYTLQRLGRTADFEDVYFTLLDVARTYYADPAEQEVKLAAITAAYAAVGIPRA